MNKLKLLCCLLLLSITSNSYSQEQFGKTLNIGIGLGGYAGYYGYVNRSIPVIHVNYEFDVARNFTLAPFISFYSRTNKHYWGNEKHPERYYRYRETVVPIGVKGSYYFDEILEAGSKWDFYLAGSIGVAIVRSHWEDGYDGDRDYYGGPGMLFLDLHVGTEFHINPRIGLMLDLSSGVSTIGLSVHSKS
jgi:hypothetical protein